MTWRRPGPEGSSCFYEPGNCRLSLGCASCPCVSKFHIITWVSVEFVGVEGDICGDRWQLHGRDAPFKRWAPRDGSEEWPGEDKLVVGENI